jgi:TetR/AcrR family transcriptional regulator of autoinduction and epiphytic fitness
MREEAKREQIRTAAQRLFLEHGFGGATTDAIAEGAGVSKETLYRYFPSKEELLADVLRHLIAGISRDGSAVGAGGAFIGDRDDLRGALLDLARRFIDDLMRPEYLALMRVIINETPASPGWEISSAPPCPRTPSGASRAS